MVNLFQKQGLAYKAALAANLRRAGLVLEGEMHNLVAIDTGALDKSIQTFPQEVLPGQLIQPVGSEGISYAGFVNDGVGEVYNYHRRNGASRPIVYTGDGQRWAQRSVSNKRDSMFNILRSTKIN